MTDVLTARTGRVALIVAIVLLAGVAAWRLTRPVAQPLAPEIAVQLDAAKQLTEADPADARGWSTYGAALVDAGPGTVTPEALTAFRRANALDPKEPRARFFLGVAKGESGDAKGALDEWFALLADSPANAPWEPVVRGAIDTLSRQAKIDVSARLGALRPAGPTRAQVEAVQAMSPDQQRTMIAGMVDRLAARLKSQPNDVEGWQMLMRSRAQLGQQDAARAALREAKAANPGSAAALDATAKELGL